jgi:polyisoprenoid-binding protein YceI
MKALKVEVRNLETLTGWALPRRFAIPVLLFLVLCVSPAIYAQQVQVTLNPSQTTIAWSLSDPLHTVHGTFKLKSGVISFDPRTGVAGGEIVVDATSGESGSHARDSKMHKEVLESKRYPEITFLPKKVSGKVGQGASNIQVQGVLHIHGADHDLTLSVPVQRDGDLIKAETAFEVPYQAWGMKNPSTLFLRVSNKVDITVSSTGRITPASMPGR